jgi:dTDP-4-dehydrorhamnose reductase
LHESHADRVLILILVTGASGLLGANLVLAAQQRQLGVVAVYHQHHIYLPGIESVQADLTDVEAANGLFRSYEPRWVVHCAAATNVDWCEDHPDGAYRLNADLSRNLASAAQPVGASLLYISTDSVFDGRSGHYAEDDVPAPVNVYAASKLAGEKSVSAVCEHVLIVRTNIYGWNAQKKQSLAEWVLSRLESNQPVPGFTDVVFTPLLVNDLSEILLDMIHQRRMGLYHVAGSQSCSKYEFARQLGEVFGFDLELVKPVSVDGSNLRAPRPKNTSLRAEKISHALGRVMPDVQAGLRRFKQLRDSGFVAQLTAARRG